VEDIRHWGAGFFDLRVEQKIADPFRGEARTILAETGRLARRKAFRNGGRGVVAVKAIHFAESDFAGNQGRARKGGNEKQNAERPEEETFLRANTTLAAWDDKLKAEVAGIVFRMVMGGFDAV
jgi:hypothetical protein